MDSFRLALLFFVIPLDTNSNWLAVTIMSSSSNAAAATAADGDRSPTIIACSVVLTVFATAVVSLRFYVRCKMVRSVKSEDWLMLVSMVRFSHPGTDKKKRIRATCDAPPD